MSSPAPTSALHVGYSTYRSKRHSQNLSAGSIFSDQASTGTPDDNWEKSFGGAASPAPTNNAHPSLNIVTGNRQLAGASNGTQPSSMNIGEMSPTDQTKSSASDITPTAAETSRRSVDGVPRSDVTVPPTAASPSASSSTETPEPSSPNGTSPRNNYFARPESAMSDNASSSSSVAGPSASKPPPRPGSSFRHIPLRSSQPTTPSPLRGSSAFSTLRTRTISSASQSSFSTAPATLTFGRPSPTRFSAQSTPTTNHISNRGSSPGGAPQAIPRASEFSSNTPISSRPISPAIHPDATSTPISPFISPSPSLPPLPSPPPPVLPAIQTSTLVTNGASQSARSTPTPVPTPDTALPTSAKPASPLPKNAPAPYRQGFQPKGVYSSRSDDFIALRSQKNDARKTQDKRLERRLEKLIELHFSPKSQQPALGRRASSFMDFSEIKGKGASELWKNVLESTQDRTERHVRDREQSIVHWEDDASVSACPICSQQFNVLSNRKHHCRMCGRVVCSLPPRQPTRPHSCSLLIKADLKTGRIEEVPDVIAYGVSRKGDSHQRPSVSGQTAADREAYLKGIRICRDCHSVVQRQQYDLERNTLPAYARLHNLMIRLERDIQESLPQFHELMSSFASSDGTINGPHHHRSAIEARQKVLSSFAEYDGVAKRIRNLSCIPGSSQDRLQTAIVTRANLFLQQHMFPLKSLPGLAKHSRSSSGTSMSTLDTINPGDPSTPTGNGPLNHAWVDPDSELALTLQPLLEQEALLECYVEEATAARKFEDAKALKTNLDEIRLEIGRIAKGGKLLGMPH